MTTATEQDATAGDEYRECARCGDKVRHLSTDDLCDGCVADTAGLPPAGVLVWVKPGTLLIGDAGEFNIRTRPDLDPEFLADIKAKGVLTPIRAVRVIGGDQDGQLKVRDGQLRALAALNEAPDRPVPVFIAANETDQAAAEQVRIVEQWAANERRTGLSAADQAAAIQGMLDLGVKPSTVARKLGIKDHQVQAARALAGHQAATDAAWVYGLSLEQAAGIADLDDGTTEGAAAAERLLSVAENDPRYYDHTLSMLRDERDQRAAIAAKVAELEAEGVKVVTSHDQVAGNSLWNCQLSGLTNSKSAEHGRRKAITVKQHAKCPGHAAWVTTGSGRSTEARVEWVCTAPAKYGHKSIYSAASSAIGRPDGAEMKRVRDGNARWRAARKVRQAWLREFAQRPAVPAGGLDYLFRELAGGNHTFRSAMERSHRFAAELAGIPKPAKPDDAPSWQSDPPAWPDAFAKASPKRAQLYALFLMLAAVEDEGMGDHTWREPDGGSGSFHGPAVAERFLTFLASCGYTLSPIEEAVVDGQKWQIPAEGPE